MKTFTRVLLIILAAQFFCSLAASESIRVPEYRSRRSDDGFMSQMRTVLQSNAHKLFDLAMPFKPFSFCAWVNCADENQVEEEKDEIPPRISMMNMIASYNQHRLKESNCKNKNDYANNRV